jgi:ATP-dependent exoDNAse (exonuclease V) beta subunit
LPSPSDELEGKLFKSAVDFINRITDKYSVVAAEKLVFSPALKLAGTFDLLLEDKETGEMIIADWKTNEEIKTNNYFSKGLSVLNFMDDCNFNHYSLQLNLYQYILEKEGYYPYFGFKKELYHIHENGVDIYPIENMQNIIKLMLS